ncbi:MAG: hypothetical protein ACJ8J0_24720 [Longimicrobiaceae bacterium]
MHNRILASAALLLGAALLASCDSPLSGDPTPSTSFRYSGPISGRYSVTAPRSALHTQPYVEGITPANNAYVITSMSPVAAGKDWLIVQGPWAPGDYAVDTCGVVALCPGVWGSFHPVDANGFPQEGGRMWRLTHGTITILQPPREGWIRGRFSGTAAVDVYTAGEWRSDGVLTISDGRFEADLVEKPITSY